jgi:hypothetical protein
MEEFVENDHVKIWKEGDIVNVLYKPGSIWGIKAAKEAVALRLKFTEGKIYKAIAYIANVRTATPEAREYLSSAEAYEGVNKVAIVTHAPISTLLGNLFISINKPPKPTRLFKSKEEALKWLNKSY